MELGLREVGPGVWHARAKHVGWVLITDGAEVTLVDTGYPGDRSRLLASLELIGRAPSDVAAVVLTHAHPDHLGSAEYLRTRTSTPVLTHELEAANARGERIEQVSVAAILARLWRPDVFVWVLDVLRLEGTRVRRLSALETFTDGSFDIPGQPVPVHTPGHTSGHCVLHLPERGVLIAGDALMTDHALARRSGPQLLPDFFHTDPTQARRSLHRITDLAADVVVPGHGPAFQGTPRRAVDIALSRP